jgi:beta-glucanase (GH16 family)
MRNVSSCFKTSFTMVAALLLVFAFAAPSWAGGQPKKPGSNGKPTSAWRDDFSGSSLNTQFWVIGSGQAPGYIPGYHLGDYLPSHVQIVEDTAGSYLRLLLSQEFGTVDTNPAGVLSHGAIVYSKSKYGYGTYEWRMRMSSTSPTPTGDGDSVSGSVSAGFVYVNNSQTEIDFEFSAIPEDANTLYMVNWLNPHPHRAPTDAERTYDTFDISDISAAFHDYKFVWQAGIITFYVDDVAQATHTTNVPSAPAYFMINHWGTDSGGWGGSASTGVSRYFYVDWVQYTPLQ